MKRFNVFLFRHREADLSDPPNVRWITVFAKSKADVRIPAKHQGYFVDTGKTTAHECGVAATAQEISPKEVDSPSGQI